MAGYRAAAMVRTPWGDAGDLRARKLPPGRGTPPEEVARSQRERLFGAMVAVVSEKGYEATRVTDLLALSGVSRKAFYEHFADKRECFLAAVQALVDAGTSIMLHGYNAPGSWEQRVQTGLEAFTRLLAAQPAAARMCFVEIYGAGEPAIELVERTFNEFEGVLRAALAETEDRAGMPEEIVRALTGGLRKVIHTRLHRGQEADLDGIAPALTRWAMSYYPPPEPLRQGRRPRRTADGQGRAAAEHDQAERIMRALAEAVAERGYTETTLDDIVGRASCSLSTFYAFFADKEEAMLATLDRGGALLLATVLPAFRRGGEWPQAVRNALGAMMAYAIEEPAFAKVGAVDVYAAGRRALEQRNQVMEGMGVLLAQGYEVNPEASPIAAEAIGGAIYALTYDQVLAGGAESLPEIAPLATYIALTPFLGPAEAVRVANGDGRRAAR
jgi:AcrR family transcriptional regulator